jgi:hypothetical protein
MLIERKIVKAQKKLDLLEAYIHKYDMDFGFHDYFDGTISMTSFFISEPGLCGVLKVTKQTLRNWRQRGRNPIYSIESLPSLKDVRKSNDQSNEKNIESINTRPERCRYYNLAQIRRFLLLELNQ